jgi:hypothetical protein
MLKVLEDARIEDLAFGTGGLGAPTGTEAAMVGSISAAAAVGHDGCRCGEASRS